jgi:hypothetical protein
LQKQKVTVAYLSQKWYWVLPALPGKKEEGQMAGMGPERVVAAQIIV